MVVMARQSAKAAMKVFAGAMVKLAIEFDVENEVTNVGKGSGHHFIRLWANSWIRSR